MSWGEYNQHLITKARIISHNMIVEEKRPGNPDFDYDPSVEEAASNVSTTGTRQMQQIQSKATYDSLKQDFIETCYQYKSKRSKI
ncbi:hypothetical protein BD560DRAFT_380888 [Blakeslea trispora]|nr:hypothetical protein BD560DRAFT_380888 [Blakeslea trispora]